MLCNSARAFLFVMLGFSMGAQADTLGPLDGRSPDPSQMSQKSVEVGYVSEGDVSTIAGRFNYQYTPLVTLYGDFGLVDIGDDTDGNAFGIGVRYYLAGQRLMPEWDLAVRASYHTASVEFGDLVDFDLSEITVAAHFGGKEAFYSNGIKWYGVLSYNRLSTESAFFDDDETEIGLGAGVYMPLGPGEIYAGVENIDDLYIGIGYRHFLGGASN